MGSGDEVVEIDSLEKGLLLDAGTPEETESEDDSVLYSASFQELEEIFVKYQTVKWVLYSLLLVLAWGIGLFMLLYIPVRRFILRKDIRSRRLYLTPNAIVYKVTRPVPFPCFGVLQKEKHVLLHSVADVVIEQGYLQSLFGVYSLRIENVGVRRPPSDDVQIQGIANPNAFRKAVLMHLSNMRTEVFSRQASTFEDSPNLLGSPSKSVRHDSFPHSGELLLLQKLEEVGSSVKRVQTLIEEQHSQTSEPID
ncbi:putative Transmembrane protein [Quillaja saponaria]|uniref:Transmembrane protein n=1 Tax=Quillaja saponaria TaxID=32244 RepID=A0AAD7LDV1_QUISA|nr:putative Transmembrane protein [Quillaja saponaria]KAJ7956018.1 putative Transmembrane protein [Quillaja saponaria]